MYDNFMFYFALFFNFLNFGLNFQLLDPDPHIFLKFHENFHNFTNLFVLFANFCEVDRF